MHRSYIAAAAALVTGFISIVLSWVVPWPVWWTWSTPIHHHHFAFPVLAWVGYIVPATAVSLALFFVLFAVLDSLKGHRA